MGYIGFPLACLLSNNMKVNCIDKDKKKIKKLKNRQTIFKEKNLNNLFKKNFKNLNFDNKIDKNRGKSIFFISSELLNYLSK